MFEILLQKSLMEGLVLFLRPAMFWEYVERVSSPLCAFKEYLEANLNNDQTNIP